MNFKNQRFELGRLVGTPGAIETMKKHKIAPLDLLERHMTGDWGEVSKDDKLANDQALELGERVLSSYKVGSAKVWIITEADRKTTTILLPSEY